MTQQEGISKFEAQRQQTLEKLAQDTRHYAKRQYTWFNNDPEILWHDVHEEDAILKDIENFLTHENA